MERASSENNDQEQDKFAVQLVVTEEQRSVIRGRFWPLQLELAGSWRKQHGDFDAGPDTPGFTVPQDDNAVECVHCLCRPCITDNINKQPWWEDEPQPAHGRVALEKASMGDFGQCCSIDLHGKMHVICTKKSAGLK